MAKQSGLHQIRGKVGEHSYYRQTGVNSGLIRGINQGLSSRVKTGDEYANTRLNNAEFGAACNVAGTLGRMVVPKYRPMVLPFSQSTMAKKVLELAKAHPGFWGQRVVTADDTADLAQILSDTSKLKIGDYMTLALTRTSATALSLAYSMTNAQVSNLLSLGIDGFNIKVDVYNVRTGQYSAASDRILHSSIRLNVTGDNDEDIYDVENVASTLDVTLGAAFPVVTGFTNHQFVTVVFQPYRIINDRTYTLQEYCMFQSFQLPEAA